MWEQMGDGTCLFLMTSLEICWPNLPSICCPREQPRAGLLGTVLSDFKPRKLAGGSPRVRLSHQFIINSPGRPAERGLLPSALSLVQILMEAASLSL